MKRAVELDPQAAGPLRSLGDLELQRGDLAAAEAHYRRALADEPDASKSFKLLAIAYAQAGRQEHAFALVEESAHRWPQDFEVQLLHALFLGIRGERAEAEKAFEAARRLRPNDPGVAGGFDATLSRLTPMLRPAG